MARIFFFFKQAICERRKVLFSHLWDLQLEALILLISSESLPHPHHPPPPNRSPFQDARTPARVGRRAVAGAFLLFSLFGGKKGQAPGKVLLGVGANTNQRLIRRRRRCCHWLRLRRPTHSRGSTAGAPAREKGTPRVRRRGGACAGRPLPPALGAPRGGHLPWPRAPAPPDPRAGPSGRRGGRTRAGGRTPWSGAGAAAASGRTRRAERTGRAHSPRRPRARRSRCGARWEPPPLTSRVARAGASPPPAARAPSLLPAPARGAACLPLPGATGAPRARAGARLRAQAAGGLCPCLPARLPASLCVCLSV